MQTSRSLIYFWRKTNPTIDGIGSEEEGGAAGLNAGAAETASRMGDSTSTLGKHVSGILSNRLLKKSKTNFVSFPLLI